MDIVIGYDINEYYAQISYAAEGAEPETLQFPSRKESGNIETALCKRAGVNQWFCGKEAVKKGVSGEGYLVEHLWRLLGEQETVIIEKTEYRVTKLCNLFLARTLQWTLQRLEEMYEEPVHIRAMVLTAEPWCERARECAHELTEGLPIEAERIFLQSHEDSLFSYLVHQPQRLLGYESGVFDLTGETLISYRIVMNHKTRPVVTTVEKEYVTGIVKKKHYASIREHDRKLEELDLLLKAYAEQFTKGRIVTALYLIGEGFGGEWYKESLKVLCRNRKVFAGNNLFGKGACYSAGMRVWQDEAAQQFIFFGKDMLRYNVGIAMWRDGQEEYVPLLDAGTNWYEAKAETVFMMEDAETIELLITPIDGSGAYKETLCLPTMPERPFRSFRMSLTAEMQDGTNLFVCVKDEGFGEIYDKLPIGMTYDLVLGEKGKQ
ncbi:MAG: hypothetical protein E7289_07115 [Lachnospiraceae bacterium]|nr:hypothetical protein [Lachnospiraceae bacterium]